MPEPITVTDEQLACAEERIVRFRRLAEVDPDRFLADLGMALVDFSGALRLRVERFDDMVAASREEIAVHRRLADRDIGYLPRLADSLQQFALALGVHRRRDEARQLVEESVTLWRLLVAAEPATYRPRLAAALTSLGNQLAELGRHDEALRATIDALRSCRDSDELLLADIHDSLGARLAALGMHADAVVSAAESVERFRALAKDDPQRYTTGLARALDNLGIRLSDTDHPAEALNATREAVELYGSSASPGRLASQTNLALRYARLEQPDAAAAAAAEAAALVPSIVDVHPADHLDGVVNSLNWLARYLLRHLHRREAAAALSAARALRRKPFEEDERDVETNFEDLLASVTHGGGIYSENGLDLTTEEALWDIARAYPHVTDELIAAARAAFAGMLDGSTAAARRAARAKKFEDLNRSRDRDR